MKTYPSFTDGTEACLLNKSGLSWFDFVINRLYMKLFKTSNIEIVELSVSVNISLALKNLVYYGRNVSVHYVTRF